MTWPSDEILFYGGAVVFAVSAVFLVVSILILHIKKLKLSHSLETQYGPRLDRDGNPQPVSGKQRRGRA